MNWKKNKKSILKNASVYNCWDWKKLISFSYLTLPKSETAEYVFQKKKNLLEIKEVSLVAVAHPLLGVMKKSEEMYTWPLSEDGRNC